MAEASLVNHERFPGRVTLKSALLNDQTWFARSGTGVAELGSPAGFGKKKKNSCRDWSSELCCSRKKVVEPMGKTSLVLDMVDRDVQEHDSGQRWNKFLLSFKVNFTTCCRSSGKIVTEQLSHMQCLRWELSTVLAEDFESLARFTSLNRKIDSHF